MYAGELIRSQVDEQCDTAVLALSFPLLVTQALDGLSANQSSVRVEDDDDLSSLVGMHLDLRAQGGGVIVETLVGGLGTDCWVRNTTRLIALGVQFFLDNFEAVGGVPCARRKHENGLVRDSGHGGLIDGPES